MVSSLPLWNLLPAEISASTINTLKTAVIIHLWKTAFNLYFLQSTIVLLSVFCFVLCCKAPLGSLKSVIYIKCIIIIIIVPLKKHIWTKCTQDWEQRGEKESDGDDLKVLSTFLEKRLLTFELHSRSNDTPPFRAPEAMCWLAAFVYRSVPVTLFVSHLQSQDCVRKPELFEHTLNRQLVDQEKQFTEFGKKVYWLRIADSTFNL